MIRIKAYKAGFRRCGIAHPAEWVEYEDDRFSEAELERLKDEPMLKVEVVTDSAPKDVADDQGQSAASTVKADKEPVPKKTAKE